MNGLRASSAIVRRGIDRRFAADWAIAFGILATIVTIFAPLLDREGFTRVTIAFAVLPIAGGIETRQAAKMRGTSYFAMPLFGRQLARALAVAPMLASLAGPLGFAFGLALRGAPLSADLFVSMLFANVAGSLVALSAVFRDGPRAWLYMFLTASTGTVVGLPYLLHDGGDLAWSGAIAAAIGFLALRAFGETLARYDPLPETVRGGIAPR